MKHKINKAYYQLRVYNKYPDYYKLDSNLYRRTLYTIKDYYKFIEEKEGNLKNEKDKTDTYSNPVEDEVINKINNNYRIEAVEKAIVNIPSEYRQMVLDHVIHDVTYINMSYVHENTLKKYTQIFIYFTAKELGEI